MNKASEEDKEMNLIAERLLKLRIKSGLTQKDVAESLGYKGGNTISNYEKCITTIPAQNVVKLCKLFNTSSDYFLGITDIDTIAKEIDDENEYILEYIQNFNKLNDTQKEVVLKLMNSILLLTNESNTSNVGFNQTINSEASIMKVAQNNRTFKKYNDE